MEKLDRLGWADGISFVSYGVRVGIRTNRPEVLEQIQEYLPPGRRPAASPVVDLLYSLRVGGPSARRGVRHFHLLYGFEVPMARTALLEEALRALESDVHLSIADLARRRVFVHAGVVGWRGRAIVIPGRSHTGKTSLVRALMKAGATYYSDEFAVLDARGWVHPYPKPLYIRHGAQEVVEKCDAATLGGVTGTRPLPVGLVVATHYRPGARWRPRQVSPGVAFHALLDNTVSARRRPAAAMATLSQVVSRAVTLKGVRGDAESAAEQILKRLDC